MVSHHKIGGDTGTGRMPAYFPTDLLHSLSVEQRLRNDRQGLDGPLQDRDDNEVLRQDPIQDRPLY